MTSHLIFLVISTAMPLALLFWLTRVYKKLRQCHEQCNNMLQEKELIYGFVHDVAEVFAEADSVELSQMLRRVLFYALRTSKASAGAIYMLNDDENMLFADAISGIFPPLTTEAHADLDTITKKTEHIVQAVKNRPIHRSEGLIGEVADMNSAVLIEDAERDARIPQYKEDFLKIRSVLLVPMRFHQQVLGVLVVINRVDGRPFCEADMNLLQSLADQATVSVHFVKLREQLNMKQRIDHDLDVARSIQSSLLPREIPRIEGIELAAFNFPALEVGGDYYDCFMVDDDHIGIAIADVSGKGISGAIMTALCRSILRAQGRGNTSPAQVLREVNHLMVQDIAEDMFVTILYMVLNINTHEITIARAGHERPLLIQTNEDSIVPVDSAGAALGLVEQDDFDRILNEVRIKLEPGAVLVAYTDGISEAMNDRHQEWGMDNFCEAVKIASKEGAHSVLNNVRQRLMRFVGDTAPYDDMTLIALRVMK